MSPRIRALCRQARSAGFRADWRETPDLGAMLVAGADATVFLQAQLTSDVAALAPGEGQLSARLNRKGALTAWFSLHRLPERGQPHPSFLAILPAVEVPLLIADLDRYVVSEDVVLEDVTADFAGEIAQGPTLSSLPELPPDLAIAADADGFTIARSWTGDPGWLRLTRKGIRPAGPASLPVWDDTPETRLAWSWLLIEAGHLRIGRDLDQGACSLPETGLESRVVSYTKGCYLGQEVVARIRTYGSVPRALRGLLFDDRGYGAPLDFPSHGEPLLTADGARIGAWASCGWSEACDAHVALAFVDRAHRTPGTSLELRMADGNVSRAEVRLLPFHAATDARTAARHHHERAIHLFGRGQDDQAVALLESALRLDPTLREAYEALGVILGRRQQFAEAIDVFRRLEEIAPDDPMVHTNLSLFYMKIGDKEEAENQKAQATLKRFAALDSARADDAAAAAAAADRRADAERKLAMFAEVLDIDPEDPLALAGMGQALVTLERLEEAEPVLARARKAQPDNSPLYASHGKLLERLGRADEAAAAYRDGIVVASRKGDLMPLREMEHRLVLLDAGQGAPAVE